MKKSGKNMQYLKENNQSTILKLLHSNGMMSRVDIANIMNLSPASITITVNKMIEQGFIYEAMYEEERNNRIGRKKIFIDINYDFKKIFGIKIEEGKIFYYLGDMKLNIIDSLVLECDTSNKDLVLNNIVDNFNILISRNNINKNDLLGIGISLVGIVDRNNGISLKSWNILEHDFKIKDELENLINIPIFIQNNVRALALANKYLNYPEELADFMFIRYANGIGSAISINESFYQGENFKSGEIGHTFVDDNNIVCRCGKTGCLETVASTWQLKSLLNNGLRSADLIGMYGQNETVTSYYNNAMICLAKQLHNSLIILDINNIVLYGYVFKNEILLNILIKELESLCKPHSFNFNVNLVNDTFDLEGSSTLSISLYEFIKRGGQI